MMKVLYAAYRHDPCDPMPGSGVDFNYLTALEKNGIKTKVVGPFNKPPIPVERVIRKIYKNLSNKKYLKYDLSNTRRASSAVIKADKDWKPDLIFSLYPPPLTFYNGDTPIIFVTDTTFLGMQKQGAEFLGRDNWIFNLSLWQEKGVLRKSSRIFTYSEWSKKILVNDYGIDHNKIRIFPMPSALPNHVIPETIDPKKDKELGSTLRLLLVGRDFRRKGVDKAVEVVDKLNERGVRTELTICGLSGYEDQSHVKYVGPYNKTDKDQLKIYTSLYHKAHLLIHPARFEAAGIVPGEAAAFGTPTITNDAGGLGTTVKNSVSGIVLPFGSPPKSYVKAIIKITENPEQYYQLCRTSRQRYEDELNWDVAGKQICKMIRDVIDPSNI